MDNLASATFGRVMIAVQNQQMPSDKEWDYYLTLVRSLQKQFNGDMKQVRGLVFSDGGVPNAAQRTRVREIIEGHSIDTALVSDSVSIRIVSGILSVFTPGFKVFSPPDWRAGLNYIGVAEADRPALYSLLRSMSPQVGTCKSLKPLFDANIAPAR
jgi:hypothetical protein